RSVPYARGVSRTVSGCGTLAGGQRATTNPWTWIMRLPWRSRLVHVVLLGILLGGSPVGASATWEQVTTVEGMRVERRPLPGTGCYEVRVVASAPFPPHLIFETLWRHHEYPEFVPYLKHLTILQEAPNTKVIYEQITMPFVQDRDYTVKVTAERDPETGRIQ